jgi:hypothetical protein
MTKQDAQLKLEAYLTEKTMKRFAAGVSKWLELPIEDEFVSREIKHENGSTIIEDWTFRGLLKIAYDL